MPDCSTAGSRSITGCCDCMAGCPSWPTPAGSAGAWSGPRSTTSPDTHTDNQPTPRSPRLPAPPVSAVICRVPPTPVVSSTSRKSAASKPLHSTVLPPDRIGANRLRAMPLPQPPHTTQQYPVRGAGHSLAADGAGMSVLELKRWHLAALPDVEERHHVEVAVGRAQRPGGQHHARAHHDVVQRVRHDLCTAAGRHDGQ